MREATRAGSSGAFREIPLASLRESKLNPRRTFDAKALADLEKSIREKGVLVPILARPVDGHFEIVAGARRFRACVRAGLAAMPAIVRELTDEQALEAQVIENLQRADVHPLEEAEGYRQLLDRAKHTVQSLAAKVGKSERYVYQRLKLADLVPPAKTAFLKDEISVAHAILLARLQPADQKRMLGEAKRGTVRDLAGQIDYHVHLDLAKAPFPKDDAKLLPHAKGCVDCPKRTGANPMLFADVAKGDTCTDPACFHAKEEAFVKVQLAAHPELAKLSAGFWYGKKAHGLTGWTLAGAKTCKSTVRGIVIEKANSYDDERLGQTVTVCTSNRCQVHHGAGSSSYRPSPAERKRQQKIREESAERKLLAPELAKAIYVGLRGVILTKRQAVLRAIAAKELDHLQFGEGFSAALREAGIPDHRGLRVLRIPAGVGTGDLLALVAAGTVCEGCDEKTEKQILAAAGVDRKKLLAEAKAKAMSTPAAKRGVCRICGCTEAAPCSPPCSWADATKTLCTNPKCLRAGNGGPGKGSPTKRAGKRAVGCGGLREARAAPTGQR